MAPVGLARAHGPGYRSSVPDPTGSARSSDAASSGAYCTTVTSVERLTGDGHPKAGAGMIGAVTQIAIRVEDQERTKAFSIETPGFEPAF